MSIACMRQVVSCTCGDRDVAMCGWVGSGWGLGINSSAPQTITSHGPWHSEVCWSTLIMLENAVHVSQLSTTIFAPGPDGLG